MRTTITRHEIANLAAHENVPDDAHYVVVGNDGSRPCVWGAGATSAEAEADAERWLGEAETCLADEETETLEIVE